MQIHSDCLVLGLVKLPFSEINHTIFSNNQYNLTTMQHNSRNGNICTHQITNIQITLRGFSYCLQKFLVNRVLHNRFFDIDCANLIFNVGLWIFANADLYNRSLIATIICEKGNELFVTINFLHINHIIKSNSWYIYQIKMPDVSPISLNINNNWPVLWNMESRLNIKNIPINDIYKEQNELYKLPRYTINIDNGIHDKQAKIIIFLHSYGKLELLEEFKKNDLMNGIVDICKIIVEYVFGNSILCTIDQ